MLGFRLLDMRGSRGDVVGVYAGIEVDEGQRVRKGMIWL